MNLQELTLLSDKIESVMAHDNNFVELTRRLNKLFPNAKFYNEDKIDLATEKSINELIISLSDEFDEYYAIYCDGLSKFYIIGSFVIAFMEEKKKIMLLPNF